MRPLIARLKVPVVFPPSAVQLVTGEVVVPQQIHREEIFAGTPREITVALRVALVDVIELD